jgi:PPOX class probable F420-dependent enzyme
MDEAAARRYLAEHHRGVLATLRRDGRPQLSPIAYALDERDGLIKISVTQARAKVANVRRDPRVALDVRADEFYRYLVVAGTARLIEQDLLPQLRRLYEQIAGPHPDWDDYDRAMVRDRRLILAIRPERLYPLDRA